METGVLCTIPLLHASRARPSPPAKRPEFAQFRCTAASDVPVSWRKAWSRRSSARTALSGSAVTRDGPARQRGISRACGDLACWPALSPGVETHGATRGHAWLVPECWDRNIDPLTGVSGCVARGCEGPSPACDGPKTWDGLRAPWLLTAPIRYPMIREVAPMVLLPLEM